MPRERQAPIVNLGQQLLIALNKTLNDIALDCDVARPTAMTWRRGRSVPRRGARKRLQEVYGIPIEAWDKQPSPRPLSADNVSLAVAEAPNRLGHHPHTPKRFRPDFEGDSGNGNGNRPLYAADDGDDGFPPYPEAPSDDAPTLDHLRHNVACIRHDIEHRQLTISARNQLRASEQRAIGMIAKLEQAEELREDNYVRNHPAWRRLRSRILYALKPFPEASQAVLDAIRGDTDEG